MIKLNLYFVIITVSAREKDPSRNLRRYEDDLRIKKLVEENRSKWNRSFFL